MIAKCGMCIKRLISVVFLLLLSTSLVACSTDTHAIVEKKGKPVRVMHLEEQERPVILQYTGIVETDELIRNSFTASGEIEKIYIAGDNFVKRGQRMAKLRNGTELKATRDGYVMEILYKEGEFVTVGHPAFIVRNDRKVVKMGILQVDLDKITVGMQGTVLINNHELVGEIISIGEIPDARTRLYPIKVKLADTSELAENETATESEIESEIDSKSYINSVPFGAIATVQFIIESVMGIWIPITAVMADDLEYVYVIENELVTKRNIDIVKMTASEVMIVGLEPSQKVVIEGMKRIASGDRIVVLP